MPSKDELVTWAWKTVGAWLDHKKQVCDMEAWRANYRSFGGQYWPDQREAGDQVRAFINLIFSEVQLRIAVNTTQRPTAIFEPYLPVDEPLVQMIQMEWDEANDESEFDWRRSLAIKDAYLGSASFDKLLGGSTLEGSGAINEFGEEVPSESRIEFDTVNPFEIVCSPGGTDVQDLYGIAHVTNVHLDMARTLARAWGRAPHNEVEPDPDNIYSGLCGGFEDLEKIRGMKGSSPQVATLTSNSTTRTDQTGVDDQGTGVGANDMTTVAEVYTRQRNGEVRLVVVAGNECLYAGPAPILYDFPFCLRSPLPDSTSIWAPAFPQIFESLTDWSAKSFCMALEGMIDEATPLLIVDENSNIDFQSTRAGRGVNVLYKNAGSRDPVPVRPGALSPGVVNMLNMVLTFQRSVTGQTDALRGLNPPGVTSGEQFGKLIEVASTFLRPEIDAIERADTKRARLWARARGYDEHMKRVFIEPGSSAGFRRQSQAQLALQLYPMGAFGMPGSLTALRQLHKRIGTPDYEKLLDEMEQTQGNGMIAPSAQGVSNTSAPAASALNQVTA